MARASLGATVAAVALVAGCAGVPPPDWALDAHAAVDAATRAHLNGEPRIEAQEFARARRALARTGRLDLVARAELLRCAARVASLEFEPCTGFDALRADAAAADLAYADYLQGDVVAADIERLPAHHRAVALAREADATVLARIDEPLARLIAAGVLMRSGRARPEIVAQAVDTASAQGWRRPLLAWLNVQLRLAEQGGAIDEVERLKRRIELAGWR